uniref:Secreted protein n=1 Tax=Heterorhabditis bacteriophora TaxID=37862 RepID=A0A1I7WWV0_HETBA
MVWHEYRTALLYCLFLIMSKKYNFVPINEYNAVFCLIVLWTDVNLWWTTNGTHRQVITVVEVVFRWRYNLRIAFRVFA